MMINGETWDVRIVHHCPTWMFAKLGQDTSGDRGFSPMITQVTWSLSPLDHWVNHWTEPPVVN